MDIELSIHLPEEHAQALEAAWAEAAELLVPEESAALPPRDTIERFDGATVAEWVLKLAPRVVTVFTAMFGFLAKRKATVQIGKVKFENISPDDIVKILKAIKSTGIPIK
ncbi:hypothetical protein [Piscinibacter terrae]|uniref:Uncharacterized protein n=1 Tax=Piscinibacter terrae TaxID=2496871 RepID=A0A3N7HYJ3_9BURK|nr:hypothetical protein [Albitalea terrae]RQP26496.1 hypothetical protein DZC73_05680 [Albitalea terrae]